MRHIGNLPEEPQARRLGDFLLAEGIRTTVEPENGAWAVWVYDEDHVARAREEFARFQDAPDDARYADAKHVAETRRREEQRELQRQRKNTVDVRRQWERPLSARTPVATWLIAASILVAALTSRFDDFWNLGNKLEPVMSKLTIAEYRRNGDWIRYQPGLQEVRNGEIHRLVTPMFLHFSIIHLLFNMLWLRVLGGAIELRRGSWRLLGMVLAIAAASNLAQYAWSGPAFGGMSGVVFGLFGYILMKSKYEPQSGFFMPPQTAFWMIAWMLICYVGPMNIANAAHTVGLGSGIVLGLWGAFRRRIRR